MGSSSPSKQQVFDEVRRRWVKATPEEQVRQQWLRWMIHKQGYPRELLAVEKEIKELPHLFGKVVPDRRIDILCYAQVDSNFESTWAYGGGSLFPLLMVECKAEKLSEEAINQAIGYNHHVKAPFIAIANLEEMRFGHWDDGKKKYEFYPVLPAYKELMKWIRP